MEKWVLCPVCGNKTRIKIRGDTELKIFPLYCPKCKQEPFINVQQMNVSVIKGADTQTQSRQTCEKSVGSASVCLAL